MTVMTATRRGMVRCSAAAALFGATIPFATRLAGETTAPVLAGLLYLGAALAVLPVLRRRPLDRTVLRRGSMRLAAAVVAGGLLGPLLLTAGLARTPSATSSLLLNTELVATAVLAAVFFGEHLGRRVIAGTVLVLGAGIALTWSGSPELRVGALLVVGACICWGLDNCVTAELDAVAPEHITFVKGAVAGSTNVLIGLALGHALPGGWTLVGALAVGALGYGASITLWVAGARDLGAARGQLVFATAPFFGVLVAWLVFGDPVLAVEVVALVLAGLGVFCVIGSDHEHRHHHQEVVHDHEHTHDDDHHDHHHEDERVLVGARHSHAHEHREVVHAHPHVPDLHHRHDHG
jgi:drug/metabolite transporter (DMT)-like permease